MSLKIVNYNKINNRISQYYINAKHHKYPNSYDWSEVFNDIQLAEADTNFLPCSKSKPEWENAGYTVIRNSRDWAFACFQEGEDILIMDADNCECLTVDNTHTYNLSFLEQLRSSPISTTPTMRKSIGYGWWAIRANDGFLYIRHKNGQTMPNIKLNEIEQPFRQRRDDPYVYAVGNYGGKKVKFYLNGKHVMLEKRQRFQYDSLVHLKSIISEAIREVLRKIV